MIFAKRPSSSELGRFLRSPERQNSTLQMKEFEHDEAGQKLFTLARILPLFSYN